MPHSKPPPSPETTALVTQEFPRLRRFFATKTFGADEAQDLAQSTLTTFLSRDNVDQPRKFIWGIAFNKLKQHWDRRSRGRSVDVDVASIRQISTTLGTKLDRSSRLGEAMRQLPVIQQTCLEYRYGEGLKLEEVAEATGRSLASIKRDIKAGLSTMRSILGTADGDEDLGLKLGADYRRS